MDDVQISGYRPGAIGRLTELHATYYHEHWGFGLHFEAEVATEYQGRGLGNRLMREAISFCREARIRRVYLWTFAGLDAARHLYEKFGFTLREARTDGDWGNTVTHQMFDLNL